jgi:hypothetical protein
MPLIDLTYPENALSRRSPLVANYSVPFSLSLSQIRVAHLRLA